MDFIDTDGGVVATYAPTRIWDYGKAGFDRTHVLAVNWLWAAPAGPAVETDLVAPLIKLAIFPMNRVVPV